MFTWCLLGEVFLMELGIQIIRARGLQALFMFCNGWAMYGNYVLYFTYTWHFVDFECLFYYEHARAILYYNLQSIAGVSRILLLLTIVCSLNMNPICM